MSVHITMPDRDGAGLARRLQQREPALAISLWPEPPPADVDLVVAWNPPDGFLDGVRARAIQSWGAGADALLGRTPPGVPVGRLVTPGLQQRMVEYLLAVILADLRGLDGYRDLQREHRWEPEAGPRTLTIGILGAGQLGAAAAAAFAGLGHRVRTWSRRPRQLPGVDSHHGAEGLSSMLAGLDVLICLLPLTPDTRGMLNADLFAQLHNALLVNVARGAHVVDADLLQALDQGRLRAAWLDVMATEPLPTEHPFWDHPGIRITPHIAALTDPDEAAELVLENHRRVRAGQLPLYPVDHASGY